MCQVEPQTGMTERDRIFSDPAQGARDFEFDEGVARVFDDMAGRSVPFYAELQAMTVNLAQGFMQSGTMVYDLGCATGTTLRELAVRCPGLDVQFVGIDNSGPMLDLAREKLTAAGCLERCALELADIETVGVNRASVVLLLLTLQFVRPARRESLIRRIGEGLVDGGALIVVEKTVSRDSRINRAFIDHYHDFKMRNGYSELEIARKRQALENVLVPYRLDENIDLLRSGGFDDVEVFFRWYNFAGLVAVKNPKA